MVDSKLAIVDAAGGIKRLPKWLHKPLPKGDGLAYTDAVIGSRRLHTVCEEARCPNLLECWSKKTATFLSMGKACTRSCGFCEIGFSKTPPPLEEDEPQRIAESVLALGLKHVVITMVARDDICDGGASHLAAIIKTVRSLCPGVTIEVLTSDFSGSFASVAKIIEARPEVFNYNIETVQRLTPHVRHKATYTRTLALLRYVKAHSSKPMLIKSGLMLGLGESREEVKQTLIDLYHAGCHIVTIGQYLKPGKKKLLVKEYIEPQEFAYYERYGKGIGLGQVFAGPFVRSSYHAGEFVTGAVHG